MSMVLTPGGQMRPSTARQDLLPQTAERDERLLDASRKLEAVFVNQLFKAMRETIPKDSLLSGGAGEELFTEMLDTIMSEAMARRLDRGIASAIYRQLRPLLGATESTEESP